MECREFFKWTSLGGNSYLGVVRFPNHRWVSLEELVLFDEMVECQSLDADFCIGERKTNLFSLDVPHHFHISREPAKHVYNLSDTPFYTRFDIENAYTGHFVVSFRVVSPTTIRNDTILLKYSYEPLYNWTFYPKHIHNMLISCKNYRYHALGASTFVIPKYDFEKNTYNAVSRIDYDRICTSIDIPTRNRIFSIQLDMPDGEWRDAIQGLSITDDAIQIKRWKNVEHEGERTALFSCKHDSVHLKSIQHPQVRIAFSRDVEELVKPFKLTMYYEIILVYKDGTVSSL
jgi:hypothetical protein